jgi:hypothetical protein
MKIMKDLLNALISKISAKNMIRIVLVDALDKELVNKVFVHVIWDSVVMIAQNLVQNV